MKTSLFTSAIALVLCGASAAAQAPSNDDCGVSPTSQLGSNAYDLSGATTDGTPLDPSVCDMGGFGDEQIYQDVWFQFIAPATDRYIFDTDDRTGGAGTTLDTRMAIYDSASCPADALLVLACDDDQPGGLNFQAGFTADLVMGDTYKVRVGTYGPTSGVGAGDLFISIAPPIPANDECQNAQVVVAGSTPFDSRGAGSGGGLELDPAICTDHYGFTAKVYRDVWFSFTPSTTDMYDVSSGNNGVTSFNSTIAIFDQSTCPEDPTALIACDTGHDNHPGHESLISAVNLSAGSTYLIRVGSSDILTDGQIANLSITSFVPTVPFPDFCNGDGGDQAGCTDCPCGNNAPVGTIGGCLNSTGSSLRITASGDTSVSLPSNITTDLRIGASGAPPGSFCILISGGAVAPGNMANPCFGMGSGVQSSSFDGLRCTIETPRRRGGRSADAMGNVGVTNSPWGGEGGPSFGLANLSPNSGFAAGKTCFFQVINRDDPLAGCQRGLNTSQAIRATLTP